MSPVYVYFFRRQAPKPYTGDGQDLGLTALARAEELGEGNGEHKEVQRLLREIRKSSDDPTPQVSLAVRLLERLSA